jgi:hypothetical protein
MGFAESGKDEDKPDQSAGCGHTGDGAWSRVAKMCKDSIQGRSTRLNMRGGGRSRWSRIAFTLSPNRRARVDPHCAYSTSSFVQADIKYSLDLSLPLNGSIDRASPSWSTNLLNEYTTTINAFNKVSPSSPSFSFSNMS